MIRVLIIIQLLAIAFQASGQQPVERVCVKAFTRHQNELVDWQKRILDFLRADIPNYALIEVDVNRLEAIDTSVSEVYKQYQDFAQEIQTITEGLLSHRPKSTDSFDGLHNVYNKFRLLNVPALRHLLGSVDLQVRVARTSWAYNWPLRYNLSNQDGTANEIIKNLDGLEIPPQTHFERLALFRERKSIQIEKVDILSSKTEAIVSTFTTETGFCSSCLSHELRENIGSDINFRAKKDGEVQIEQSADGKKFVFIVDGVKQPLNQLITKVLLAAEHAGIKSITLPGLRTGHHFGAIEATYAQVAYETIKGVADFFDKSNGTLVDIKFAIPRNEQFYLELQRVLFTVQPYNGTFREDVRESKLSGEGFEVTPSKIRAHVDTRRSPIYQDMHLPWDLSHFMAPHPPVIVGQVIDTKTFDRKVISVLNLPIKMPKSSFRVPIEFAQFQEIIKKIIDHEFEVNPDIENYYAYLTVDNSFVRKGRTQRDWGVHVDGIQGPRYVVKLPPEHSYSVTSVLGTIFYNQPFDLRSLDIARQNIHSELARQALVENRVYTKNHTIYFWNSYSAHEADYATEDTDRTFFRIEFSKKIYDGFGDTVTPLFNYHWPRVIRPVPADLEE